MSGLIINSYSISVEIPMHEPIPSCESIEAIERFFVSRKDKEINASWCKNYERAINLIECTKPCGGKLKRIINHRNYVNPMFEFSDFKNLCNFTRSLTPDTIINSYGISVEIPMHEPIPCASTSVAKKFFINRKEKEINAYWRKNHARAEHLIYRAESCGGKFKSIMNPQKNYANLSFEFSEIERLHNFAKNLNYNIESVI